MSSLEEKVMNRFKKEGQGKLLWLMYCAWRLEANIGRFVYWFRWEFNLLWRIKAPFNIIFGSGIERLGQVGEGWQVVVGNPYGYKNSGARKVLFRKWGHMSKEDKAILKRILQKESNIVK